MERSLLIVSVLLTIACLLDSVLCHIKNDDKDIEDEIKRKAFCFHTRLCRRKRNPNGEESFIVPSFDKDQSDTFSEVMQDSPWTILMNEGKRKSMTFTPRLGRDSGEDFNSGTTSLGGSVGDRLLESDLAGELMMQRSPPFAPRLGRGVSLSPRRSRTTDCKCQY